MPVEKAPSKQKNLLYAFALGIFVTGAFTAIQSLLPETEPFWLSFDFMNGKLPPVLMAVSNTPDIILYPAFAFVLFFGIHFYTRSWTLHKWMGILLAVVAGLALSGISFDNFLLWAIQGMLTASLILLLYFFFIRFHFEWIPLGFGTMPVLKMISTLFIMQTLPVTVGVILTAVLSVSLLWWWYFVLVQQHEKR
jgi:hypothetical protein